VYQLIRPLLFRLDPETAHELAIGALRLAARSPLVTGLLRALYGGGDDPRLSVSAFGLEFPNPIGLAAGLDKDGVAVPAFTALGFGSVEVGSVTAMAQDGNPRPRLYRLPADEGLINRMGFNNGGAAALAERLAVTAPRPDSPRSDSWQSGGQGPGAERPGTQRRVPVGVNVGKSRSASLADAEDDYRAALRAVWRQADYLVFNVSSPNTPGLRDLQEREPLERLLGAARTLADELGARPVLVKLSPDLSTEQILAVADVAAANGAAGLIATNTTVSRPPLASTHAGQPGGLSGLPLAARAVAVLETLTAHTALPVVSVGGVRTAVDVRDRLRAGAVMVQVYTGFVYRGPGMLRELKDDLVTLLDLEGVADVSSLRPR